LLVDVIGIYGASHATTPAEHLLSGLPLYKIPQFFFFPPLSFFSQKAKKWPIECPRVETISLSLSGLLGRPYVRKLETLVLLRNSPHCKNYIQKKTERKHEMKLEQ
jgi:hypothetical protein